MYKRNIDIQEESDTDVIMTNGSENFYNDNDDD